jgi:hypothetical protein
MSKDRRHSGSSKPIQNSLSERNVGLSKREEFADQNLIRALNHPPRVKILDVLSQQESSPKSLEQRRGAVEDFYRALPESYIGHQLWRNVPAVLRGSVVLASLKSFVGKLTKSASTLPRSQVPWLS